MSGELKAEEDWVHVAPAAEKPRRQRKEKHLPTTRRGAILYGLRRFFLIALGLIAVVVVAAVLAIWLWDGSPSRVFPLAFYLACAVFGSLAALSVVGPNYSRSWSERRATTVNMSSLYAAFAVLFFGIAVALDFVL